MEGIERFRTYKEYRNSVILEQQAKPGTRRILTEDEFDRVRWGVGMADARNDEEHREMQRRVSATESRLDGALGHLYGAEGRGGVLDNLVDSIDKLTKSVEHLDSKFDALIMKQEQDKAAQDLRISQIKTDVDELWKKYRASGAVWRKFRDAGIGAAAIALISWLFSRLTGGS